MALLSAALGACTVGEAPGSDAIVVNELTVCEPRVAAPLTAYEHVSDPLGPRAGQPCLDGGCHAAGGAGGPFAFAGTAYKDSGAQTPAVGVTIRLYKPGGGTALAEAATDTAGNFIIRNPASYVDFPYETHVTGCGPTPDIKPMISQITAAEANCSLGGTCHGAGGGAGVIDLPD